MKDGPPYPLLLLVAGLLAAGGEFLSRHDWGALEVAGWLVGDGGAYRDVTRSLLENRSADYMLVNPQQLRRSTESRTRGSAGSKISQTVDGRFVPKHSLLLPLALLIPYAVGREAGMLLFNVAQCLLLLLLVYWLSLRYVSSLAAFAGAAVFLADGILRNYMYNVSPDVFGAVLVLSGFLCVWTAGGSARLLFLGGVLLGLSCWMRPLNLVGLVCLLPLAARNFEERRFGPSLAWPLAGFALGVAGYLWLNSVWFGSPLTTSYDRIVVMTNRVQSLASHRSDMNRPFWPSLLPTLVTSKQGFLQTAPHWPLALPCLFFLARRRPAEAFAIATLIFAQALFVVKYDYWQLSHFGNRFLFLPAAASSLGVAWLAQAALDRRADCLSTKAEPR